MTKERVLIIDNSRPSVELLTKYVLKPNGYQVLVADGGETGLEMVLEHHPDLILLNMNLSKMTGIEVLDALNSQNVKTPVIVMTFHGSETLAVQAFRMGVKDYILKPIEVTEMLEAIERALTEVRLRKERDELTQRLMASNKELEQRVKELNTLFGIGKSVTSLLNQNKLLARLVEAAMYLTNAEEGSLLLVDEQTNELYMVAARGIDERVARSFRLKVKDSLAGEVITTGQPVILTSQDFTKIKTSYLVRSLMYVPLKVKERISGVLTVDNRYEERDFTNHDLRLLSALADYAAISLDNAQLFDEAESERTKLATVLGEIEEPVIVISDEDDRIVVANAAFRNLFGIDSDQVEGQPMDKLVYNPSLLKLVAAASESGNSHKDEILLSDGRTFYASLTSVPNVGRAIVMKDVTHFKELDRMKSDFVSPVSHDLRAPLNSISDYTQMVKSSGPLNEKQGLFVDRIINGVSHITDLIDSLLDLSTIELGIEPTENQVNIAILTEDVVAGFQGQAQRNQQQLTYHTVSQNAIVQGDELRLKQVINNLVLNALKYTPAGGQITTIVQVENNQVVFKVEDNGRGIPPADLPFVFDKFYRVTSSHQGDTGGTGLGLAICKSIIEKYNGRIWVESQPGQGSVFIFTLPTAQVNQESKLALDVQHVTT